MSKNAQDNLTMVLVLCAAIGIWTEHYMVGLFFFGLAYAWGAINE
jgi:hypothetical protein